MKKIFVTAIGGDIGYGVIKALRQSHHALYIIGCDIQRYNFARDLVDEFYVSPPYSDAGKWIGFVAELLNNHKIDYFWPITEQEIRLVQKNKPVFQDHAVVINNENVLETALDKGKTADCLLEAGILAPATWEAVSSCKERFPLVVKERFGCGSHSVRVVHDHDELVREFNLMTDPVIQEYVGSADDEYTMAVFSDGNIVNSITFKRKLGFGGMSRSVELAHDTATERIAERIAEMFTLRGSINVQMRKVGPKYYVFEINPRISSTMGFRLQLGFNDTAWWIDMLEGETPEKYVTPGEKIYGVRNVEEKLFYEEGHGKPACLQPADG